MFQLYTIATFSFIDIKCLCTIDDVDVLYVGKGGLIKYGPLRVPMFTIFQMRYVPEVKEGGMGYCCVVDRSILRYTVLKHNLTYKPLMI